MQLNITTDEWIFRRPWNIIFLDFNNCWDYINNYHELSEIGRLASVKWLKNPDWSHLGESIE